MKRKVYGPSCCLGLRVYIYIYICMMISAVNLLVFDRVWNEIARVE